MTLKVVHVEGAGNLESERVVLRATANSGIGKYLVLKTKKSPDGKVFSGSIPAAYWFETINVQQGDFVILYSKAGQRSQKPIIEDGTTSYFFYWGLTEAIWASEFKPTAITAATWEWTPA